MSAKCHKWGVYARKVFILHQPGWLLISRHKTEVAAKQAAANRFGYVVRRL